MAKFMIIIEDTDPYDPDGSVDIKLLQQVPTGVDPQVPTKAAKLARYLELKISELELASERESEEAARCWH
jgi:hypothetical protein